MNSEMQRRLYEMEVTPPQAVWEKLSLNIDEINEDNRIAQKVLDAEMIPPAGVWQRIDSTINAVKEIPVQKKETVINLRRMAAAAVFIGIIVTAWILLRNNNSSKNIAETENSTQKQTLPGTNTTTEKENPKTDSSTDLSTTGISNSTASVENEVPVQIKSPTRARNYSTASRVKKNISIEPATAQYAVLNSPLNKSFDRPIDDLSLVTSDQNYLTMVNANGRLVKIPAQLASLATHLQDKPVSEDYYEVMFGEGNYWKETLDEWRKKIVSSPVTTGDAFTSLVELLKSVQSK